MCWKDSAILWWASVNSTVVQYSQEENEHNVPNRDSTPNNQIAEEDDIDSSNVLILIATGTQRTYIILILGFLATVLVGVVLIKKFVI